MEMVNFFNADLTRFLMGDHYLSVHLAVFTMQVEKQVNPINFPKACSAFPPFSLALLINRVFLPYADLIDRNLTKIYLCAFLPYAFFQ